MRQIWIPRAGAPEVLEVREAPDPTPGPGELRIRVEAAGVNYADLSARMGQYPDMPPMPCVVGYEVGGVVDQLGEGVEDCWLGAPVVAATQFGGYSSAVCLPVGQVARRPEGLDAVTAAAIPVAYLTSWMMLRVMGRVAAGDRVLIHAAAGGVGLAALDLCRRAGAEVWGSAGVSKHALLRERGCAHTLDSHTDTWPEVGMDLILDARGGESWAKGLQALRTGGRLVCFGFSAGSPSDSPSRWNLLKAVMGVPWLAVNPLSLMNANKGVLGVNMGHMWGERERLAGWLSEILKGWEEGWVRPHVHATVPFDRAAEAHQILHDRKNVGKVVLVP